MDTNYDPLTGVYSRHYLSTFLPEALQTAAREHQPLAIVFCDVDGLALINGTQGIPAGDYTLTELPKCLKAAVGRTGVIGRIGGQRFVVCMPQALLEEARSCAEQVRRRVEAHEFEYQGQPFRVTVSLGVAAFREEDHRTITELLAEAQANLERAKRQGRNQVVG
jgi:diguanylate cyclase (GGDEF)-like protein